jgi:hypothetical protein
VKLEEQWVLEQKVLMQFHIFKCANKLYHFFTADLQTGQLDAGPPADMTCPEVACIHRKRNGQQYMCPQNVTTGSNGISIHIAPIHILMFIAFHS